MAPSKSVKRIAHSTLVRLLQPHIQDILELVKASLLDENHGDPVYGLAYGIIGDLAEIFGAQIKPLLLQDWVAAELKSRRCPPENKQTMRWAREVGQFETICVPLNDFHAYLDGQTCHRVSIILCFFSSSYEPRSFPPLTILTLLVQRSQSRTFFPPWVRYTFSTCFVCRQSSFRWCLPLPPLYYIRAPPPYIPYSFPLVIFGLNHPYQSSLYRLNPNPPHHHIVISCSRSSLPTRYSERQFRSSSVHHPPACHTSPSQRCFHVGLQYILALPLGEFELLSRSLCPRFLPHILSRYLRFAHRSPRNFIKISSE